MPLSKCHTCRSSLFKPRVNISNDIYDQLRAPHTLSDSILSTVSETLKNAEKDFADFESKIRSKNHPLSLVLIGEPWSLERDGSSDHPLLEKLSKLSSRWKHVSFTPCEFTPEMYPTWDGLSLPILETLELLSSNESEAESPLAMLRNAPALRTLTRRM